MIYIKLANKINILIDFKFIDFIVAYIVWNFGIVDNKFEYKIYISETKSRLYNLPNKRRKQFKSRKEKTL